jgi:undecaprenyl-diphosphatase
MNEFVLNLDQQLLLMMNGSHSLFADGVMMIATNAFTWIPLYVALFYLVIKNNENMSQVVLVVGCSALCVFLADGVSSGIIKPLIGRMRPSNDPRLAGFVDVVSGYRGGRFGFFSSHAANTFSVFLFFALVVRNKIFTLFMLSWTLFNCYTRIYLGVHYPGDIFIGLVWGAIVGSGVYYLVYKNIYRHITPELSYISSEYSASGYMLRDIYAVVDVLLFIYIYVIIRAGIMFG